MGAVSFSLDPALLECLRGALPISTFVETGTFRGDTVALAAPFVKKVITVEISEALWKEAVARFAGVGNVEVHLGESPEVLAGIRGRLGGESTLFWLDAHWCVAESTGGERSQCPLLDEIAAIGGLGPLSVVLIDDARLFLARPPEPHEATQWPSFGQILAALRGLSDRHQVTVVNDVIAFYPPGAASALDDYARQEGVDWLRARQSLDENALLRAAVEEKEGLIHALHDAAGKGLGREIDLTRQLVAKEAVIRALATSFGWVRPLVHPLSAAAALRSWIGLALRRSFGARLGTLNQYPPRPLSLPRSRSASLPPARAPRLSVVTPSFGQARFIERTIRSVLDQEYPNLEYRVQDGSSTDGTIAILERYSPMLAGWESCPDSGQAVAINRGFAGTTGEVMGWLNSDDLFLPGALASVAGYFARHAEIDVVYGHRILVDENDDEIGRWMMPDHDDEVLSWADFVPQETLWWRRSIWDRVGGRVDESFQFAMDWDLLVRFREAGARFARLPRFLGGFRVHPRQKTCASILEVGHEEMDRIRKRVLGRVPERSEIARAIRPYLRKSAAVDLRWRLRRALRLA